MQIATLLDVVNSQCTNFKVETRPGMSRTAITAIEVRLNVKLPADLVSFYSFTNGLEGDDWIFEIIPLDEVEKLEDKAGDCFLFAAYMIYSETCWLEIDKSDSNKYRFFTWTKDENELTVFKRKYIADSIINFIQIYCDEGTFGIFTG